MKKQVLSLVLALLCLGLLPTAASAAAGDVAINEQNFPDPVFRSYVQTLPGGDDGVFTEAELNAISEICCYGDCLESLSIPGPIRDLTGIEHFTALNALYCQYNALTALDVSKNTELYELDCSGNNLSQLDVSRNTTLSDLRCSSNNIAILDLSQNSHLQSLNCSDNRLAALDCSSSPFLSSLYCQNNRLVRLQLPNCDDWKLLHCYNNQLTDLFLPPEAFLHHFALGSQTRYVRHEATFAEAFSPTFDASKVKVPRSRHEPSFENGYVNLDIECPAEIPMEYQYYPISTSKSLSMRCYLYMLNKDYHLDFDPTGTKLRVYSTSGKTLVLASYDETGRMLRADTYPLDPSQTFQDFPFEPDMTAFVLDADGRPVGEPFRWTKITYQD